jgi:serine/threonine-protein kinase HipA
MRTAKVFVKGFEAGILTEIEPGKKYRFLYYEEYNGYPVSLTMPVDHKQFDFDTFPSFFDGLLPEGIQLEGLLNIRKIDRDDCFSQLMAVGEDLVGAVTVKEIME